MSIPINIEILLSGTVVEGTRLELEEGWNPTAVMRTVCVFANDFEKGIIRIRRYRNRRIGGFLKELELTEGRGTGIPTIIRTLKDNGSPAPLFDTDEPDRRYFVTEIKIHPDFIIDDATPNEVNNELVDGLVNELVDELVDGLVDGLAESQQHIIKLIKANPKILIGEMADRIGISRTAIDKNLKILKNKKIIRRVGNSKTGHWEILNSKK